MDTPIGDGPEPPGFSPPKGPAGAVPKKTSNSPVSRELSRLQAALREASASHLAAQEELIAAYLRRAAAGDAAQTPPAEGCARESKQAHTAIDPFPGSGNILGLSGQCNPIPATMDTPGSPDKRNFALPKESMRNRPSDGECPPDDGPGSRRSSEASARTRMNLDVLDNPGTPAESGGVHLAAFSGLRSSDNLSMSSAALSEGALSTLLEGSAALKLRYSSFVRWWSKLQEPERTSRFARLVDGNLFQSVLMAAIIGNGLFISYQTNYAMDHLDGYSDQVTRNNMIAELFFVAFFALELVLKFSVHGIFFLVGEDRNWNIFDCVVVFISVLDFVFTYMDLLEGMNMTLLRLCRLFKLSKVFRMFRAFRFVSELRLLLKCVMGCFSSLFWSGIMLCFLKFLFGLYFVQSATSYLKDERDTISEDEESKFLRMFGSVQGAMITLLKATTGGQDWEKAYILMAQTGMFAAALFLFYIVFFMVAVWNIVTSIFIEKIMLMAAPNMEQEAFERRRQAADDTALLLSMAHSHDRDKSGTISWEEFVRLMEDEKFSSYFTVRGIDIKDGETFFKMLTTISGTDDVPLELFVSGCLRCKGTASSVDLYTLEYEFKLMHSDQRLFQATLLEQFNDLVSELQLGTEGGAFNGSPLARRLEFPAAQSEEEGGDLPRIGI